MAKLLDKGRVSGFVAEGDNGNCYEIGETVYFNNNESCIIGIEYREQENDLLFAVLSENKERHFRISEHEIEKECDYLNKKIMEQLAQNKDSAQVNDDNPNCPKLI